MRRQTTRPNVANRRAACTVHAALLTVPPVAFLPGSAFIFSRQENQEASVLTYSLDVLGTKGRNTSRVGPKRGVGGILPRLS